MTFKFRSEFMAAYQWPFSVEIVRFDRSAHTIAAETQMGHPISGWRFFRVYAGTRPNTLIFEIGAMDVAATDMDNWWDFPIWFKRQAAYYTLGKPQLEIWRQDLEFIAHDSGGEILVDPPGYTEGVLEGFWEGQDVHHDASLWTPPCVVWILSVRPGCNE